MKSTNRRVFMIQVATGSTALACGAALAAPSKRVEETEPKAVSLGYKHDTAQVDSKKFSKHKPTEKCSGCMAWLGKPAEPWAECDLMADRMVSNGGWCSSFVKTK